MYMNEYLPEGKGYPNPLLREYTLGISGLEKAMNDGVILEGKALSCGSGRDLTVEFGNFTGILPFDECVCDESGSPVKPIAAISRVGKTVCFKIKDMNRNECGQLMITLSRRAAQKECRDEYISRLVPGDIIPAKITHLEAFGAFADVGCGVISLMTIDGMSVSRISHPSDRFYTGQYINAAVKSPADEYGRILLTHRELLGTWEENASRFTIGQTVTGIVRSVEKYGVFIELAPNLAGLAEYDSEIRPGECVSVYIKNILPQKMKIKLVIIDRAEDPGFSRDYKYFITSGHLSSWRYSPADSPRVIETVFDQ